jgi:N4-gp56 family major capsid protein
MADAYSGVSTAGSFTALPQAILDVYSMGILHEAMGIMMFEDFMVKKEELGKMPGQSITMTRYNNITRGGQLDEETAMEVTNMSAAQHAITVTEWGNAIGVSEKLIQMSFDDQLTEAGVLLGRDYAVVNDLMCRDAIAGASQVVYAGNRSARASMIGGTDYFDVEMVRQAVEILQTKNAPKFNGDFYVGFVHPHQAAYLKRDPDWIAANNYANTRALFTGELGRWEDVVFISTTHCRNGAAGTSDPGYLAALVNAATGGASNADVYECLFFGDSAVGKATGLPVEMRDNGVQDFGRKHSVAWYAIMGAGILEDDFIVRGESV